MTRSDEDALFLRSIPNGVLEEFRAEVCLPLKNHTTLDSFLRNLTHADVLRVFH